MDENPEDLIEIHAHLMESAEAERLRLALDLHDGPIQDLYAVYYQLKEIFPIVEDQQAVDVANDQGAAVIPLVRRVIAQLRSLCGELRPPTLIAFGLEEAIRSHIGDLRNAYPALAINLELEPGPGDLPKQVQLAFYRVYQQAISNVIRHAQAGTIWVRLSSQDHQAQLEIQDDGCGFELPEKWAELSRRGHYGIVGSFERARSIGGYLEIRSQPNQGTAIQLTAPILPEGGE